MYYTFYNTGEVYKGFANVKRVENDTTVSPDNQGTINLTWGANLFVNCQNSQAFLYYVDTQGLVQYPGITNPDTTTSYSVTDNAGSYLILYCVDTSNPLNLLFKRFIAQ